MSAPPFPYRLITGGARALLPAAALFSSKLRANLTGRRLDRARVTAWHLSSRDSGRPLLHLHAASAGELRQAEPVLTRLRARHPDWQVAVTCFSPSGSGVASALGADLAAFLPWDRPDDVAAFLRDVQPQVMLIAKLDVWPEFVLAAKALKVKVGLFAATVRPGSRRTSGLIRTLTRSAYASLDIVTAVAEPDAARLTRMGVRPDALAVLGDPRADAVTERLHGQDPAQRWPRLADGGPALVAGSTWREDEAVLLKAFSLVRQSRPDARLVLVPHEPTAHATGAIARQAAAVHLPAPVDVETADASSALLLEHRMGTLGLLYGLGAIGYVGGGFGRSGLHSVLEPAGWSLPVITGPRWTDQRDAARLIAAGGLVPLPATGSATELARRWLSWLGDEPARRMAGMASRRALDEDCGAADRIVDRLEPLFAR
ncbi:MAG: glycosyltransferase N-terminal domain-containing protein [Gemmatimonadales bacterium]